MVYMALNNSSNDKTDSLIMQGVDKMYPGMHHIHNADIVTDEIQFERHGRKLFRQTK